MEGAQQTEEITGLDKLSFAKDFYAFSAHLVAAIERGTLPLNGKVFHKSDSTRSPFDTPAVNTGDRMDAAGDQKCEAPLYPRVGRSHSR